MKASMMLAGVLFALMGSAAARTAAECESNTMNLGRENLKSGLGFTGRLAYAGEKYPDWVETWLARPLPRPRQALESAEVQLARLNREKPWGFRRVDSLLEELDLSRRMEAKTWIETVDGEYPRIYSPMDLMVSGTMWFYLIVGRYEADPTAEHVEIEWERRSRDQKPSDQHRQIGVQETELEGLYEALKQADIFFRKCAYDFGEGKNYWREDAIFIAVDSKQNEKFKALLIRHFPGMASRERAILEKKVFNYFDTDSSKAYKIRWDTGKPVLMLK